MELITGVEKVWVADKNSHFFIRVDSQAPQLCPIYIYKVFLQHGKIHLHIFILNWFI